MVLLSWVGPWEAGPTARAGKKNEAEPRGISGNQRGCVPFRVQARGEGETSLLDEIFSVHTIFPQSDTMATTGGGYSCLFLCGYYMRVAFIPLDSLQIPTKDGQGMYR